MKQTSPTGSTTGDAEAALGELLDGKTIVEIDTNDDGSIAVQLLRADFDRPVVRACGPTPREALLAAYEEATR